MIERSSRHSPGGPPGMTCAGAPGRSWSWRRLGRRGPASGQPRSRDRICKKGEKVREIGVSRDILKLYQFLVSS